MASDLCALTSTSGQTFEQSEGKSGRYQRPSLRVGFSFMGMDAKCLSLSLTAIKKVRN